MFYVKEEEMRSQVYMGVYGCPLGFDSVSSGRSFSLIVFLDDPKYYFPFTVACNSEREGERELSTYKPAYTFTPLPTALVEFSTTPFHGQWTKFYVQH